MIVPRYFDAQKEKRHSNTNTNIAPTRKKKAVSPKNRLTYNDF